MSKSTYTAVLSVIDRVTQPLKRIERQLRPFKRAFADLGNGASGLQRALSGVVAPLGAIFGGAGIGSIGMLGAKVVNTSAEFERFQTILETLEGSSDKAKASMDWVANFAAKTPYELAGVTDAFVKLRAYGIDPQAGALQSAGDAAAAMGKPLEQAVEALADAMTGENERLKEFGITAETAGDQIVYRWQENGKAMVATADKNSREQIQAVIQGIWNGRYAGAMNKLSSTWDGMWSNLQDTITKVFKMVGDAGIFEVLKADLSKLLETIQRMEQDGSLQAFAQAVSDELVKAWKELREWVLSIDWPQLWKDIKGFAVGVRDTVSALGGLKTIAIAIGVIFGAQVLSSLITVGGALWGIGSTAFKVIGILGGFSKAMLVGSKAMGLLVNFGIMLGPVGLAIGAAVAVIAGLAYVIYDSWDEIVSYFTAKFEAVTAAFDQGFVQGMVKLWQEFNIVTLIMDAFDGLVKYLFGIDLGKIIGDQIRAVTALMPDWMVNGLNLGGAGPGQPTGAEQTDGGEGEGGAAAPRGTNSLLAANKQTLQGAVTVSFENTPPGTLVKPMPTNQPGVAMEADVGYRSLAMP